MEPLNAELAYHEPESDYRKRADEGKLLNSHALIDFIHCPELYRQKRIGEITPADSSAYAFGRALHSLVLTPAEFEGTYLNAANGPVNPKTDKPFGAEAQACQSWAGTRTVLSETDWRRCHEMSLNVHRHPYSKNLLDEGEAELTLRDNVWGMAAQGRCDWLRPDEDIIIDLKSCGDLDRFAVVRGGTCYGDWYDYGYGEQLAFYRELLGNIRGYDPDNKEHIECWLCAVEKQAPYRVGWFHVHARELNRYAVRLSSNIERLRKLLETPGLGEPWPTGYEEPRDLGGVL